MIINKVNFIEIYNYIFHQSGMKRTFTYSTIIFWYIMQDGTKFYIYINEINHRATMLIRINSSISKLEAYT